jgi:hypothetical protein
MVPVPVLESRQYETLVFFALMRIRITNYSYTNEINVNEIGKKRYRTELPVRFFRMIRENLDLQCSTNFSFSV